MDHDRTSSVRYRHAQLPSRGDAEGLTRATLETLGERIPEQVAIHLADQLPLEIGEHLRRTVTMGGVGTGERFGMDEFVRRVSDRGHLAEPNAVYGARVVFEVTGEATQGVLDKVRDTLGRTASAHQRREQGRDANLNILGCGMARYHLVFHESRRPTPICPSRRTADPAACSCCR